MGLFLVYGPTKIDSFDGLRHMATGLRPPATTLGGPKSGVTADLARREALFLRHDCPEIPLAQRTDDPPQPTVGLYDQPTPLKTKENTSNGESARGVLFDEFRLLNTGFRLPWLGC